MTSLGPFSFHTFETPQWLLLLIAVVAVLLAEWFARPPGAMAISTGEVLAGLRLRHRGLLRALPPLLRALGLAFFVVALAGPLSGMEIRRDRANVKDIMLAVDVSGSMQQEDFVSGGVYRDRLYVTKEAVRDFINSRRVNDSDRFGLDRVGLILYAGFAWTQCSLTLDYDILERELALASIDNDDKRKDGTAIGSAIGLAVRRLSQSEAKSKVIILLTDGINNRGELDPITAAQVAKEYGIRVYTIGAGSTEGGSVRAGGLFRVERQPIDEDALKRIADITGGKYYRATDLETLQGAYDEINQLETTEIDVGDYYQYESAAAPYVVTGAILLLAAMFTRRRYCETIP
ncbi:MAG: VWA domain-containing protein [Candidatus Hydrogenedens sp.]|nr:VWA domain-containing protein [Candidatus Hydrogenedens sp.]